MRRLSKKVIKSSLGYILYSTKKSDIVFILGQAKSDSAIYVETVVVPQLVPF
jgi:hypothetical protein